MFKFFRFKSCMVESSALESSGPKPCAETAGTALRLFMADEGGTTAIEYALIASGVSIIIAASVVAIGSSVQGMFQGIASALK